MALADGAGVGRGGRQAAEIAVRQFLSGWHSAPETWGVRRAMETLLPEINAQVRREAPAGAVCTFTALVLSGREAHVAHAGDSRAWLVRGGRWTQVTTDHCWGGPDIGAALYRAVGLDDTLQPQLASIELEPGDWFVLASDGVHKFVDPSRYLPKAPGEPDADPQAFVEALVREARRSGDDDATALAVRVDELPERGAVPVDFALAALPCWSSQAPGAELDGFVLESRLARGTQSEVWSARDARNDTDVVLKFPDALLCRDEDFRENFLREEWLGCRLDHPHIAGNLRVEPGRRTRLYQVLRRVPGRSLRTKLREDGPLDAWTATQVAMDMARALMELHRVGVLHRDVKPENILVRPDGRAVLLDLGVARVEAMREGGGSEPGTPSYMAPELFDGAVASESTEVYSLGATLYECLTAKLPYGEIEVFSRPVFGEPVPPTRYQPTLPPWLESIVLRAVQKDPGQRFEVVSEILHLLETRQVAGVRATSGPASTARERFWTGAALVFAFVSLLELFLLLRG